jgi:acetyl esterase
MISRDAAASRALRMLALATCGLLALASPALSAKDEAASTASKDAQPFVRPDTAAYIKGFYSRPMPQLTREMLEKIHQMPPSALAAMASQDLPVGEMAVQREFQIPGPAGQLRAKLFDTRADRGPGPVVVFYHGGGYVVGSIETHAGLAAEMARRLDLPVVSIDYRLAPENPWPAAPDDGEAAARWIAANGKSFGREATGLVLTGDSAGGNLTLIATAALRDKPAAVPVIMQIPIYPATDFTRLYPSSDAFANGYTLDRSGTALMTQHYAADPGSLRTSPLLGDLAGLPPTVLVTASLDPLRDQGRAYAAKLIEAGVPTSYYEGKGLIHGFATYRRVIPSAQVDTLAFLKLARTMLDEMGAK